MTALVEAAAALLERVRAAPPRTHCLTNSVVQKFTADGLTAMGIHPSMTGSVEEAADFALGADALLVNLGTLDAARRAGIEAAVAAITPAGKPWALDPVHCDRSPGRLAFARELLGRGPGIVRGNSGEMAALGDIPAGMVRIETGAQDHLSDGSGRIVVSNGNPMMAKVTGTGCLAGALVASFLARAPNEPMLAGAAALAAFGIAGERAALHAKGPGSFAVALLDSLHAIGPDDIIRDARITHEPR